MTTTGTALVEPRLELKLERVNGQLRISAVGTCATWNEPIEATSHTFAPPDLSSFTSHVSSAATQCRDLDESSVTLAKALYQGIFARDVAALRGRLQGAASNEPLLVRLRVEPWQLQAIPWEAMCVADVGYSPLGTSDDMLAVRHVAQRAVGRSLLTSGNRGTEILGAVALRVVDPRSAAGKNAQRIRRPLAELESRGELEWIEPIQGAAAKPEHLYGLLGENDRLHVLHFLGHGGVLEAHPVLDLGIDGEGRPIHERVVHVAEEIRARRLDRLRLIVLEACEGAQPTELGAAARILADGCADAVVAHQWEVTPIVASEFSGRFYEALTRTAEGNVAAAMNAARVGLRGAHNAAALSPVVYLRGGPQLFDFKNRRLARPRRRQSAAVAVDPALAKLIRGKAGLTLVVGDESDPTLAQLHAKLREKVPNLPRDAMMSVLAQRYEFDVGDPSREFARLFNEQPYQTPEWISAAAVLVSSGVHATFLRLPLLENALATAHRDRNVHVIQPGVHEIETRRAGSTSWESRLARELVVLPIERDLVVLRLNRGYSPLRVLEQPLLSEDDYLRGSDDGGAFEPLVRDNPDLSDLLLSEISRRPCLLMNVSLHHWHHRQALNQLFSGLRIQAGSVALVRPGCAEAKLWREGKGLPGRRGVHALEVGDEQLPAMLRALAAEQRQP